jgi:hypothetical protein
MGNDYCQNVTGATHQCFVPQNDANFGIGTQPEFLR